MPQVLLVEDDHTIRTALTRALGERGHAVSSAHTAMNGLRQAVDERPDVVVLDLGLPDLDGREVLRMLRAVSPVPVIVATARDDEEEIVRVLDAGADDYVVKPFGAAQLDARIRAVLRRAAEQDDGPADHGRRADASSRAAREAVLDGRAAGAEPARSSTSCTTWPRGPGEVVTKRELLTEVWRMPYGGADKTVDVHLSWLRRKLGETAQDPRYLHTRARRRRQARRSGPMRRRLAVLVVATTSLVLVAFLVPLALLSGRWRRTGRSAAPRWRRSRSHRW